MADLGQGFNDFRHGLAVVGGEQPKHVFTHGNRRSQFLNNPDSFIKQIRALPLLEARPQAQGTDILARESVGDDRHAGEVGPPNGFHVSENLDPRKTGFQQLLAVRVIFHGPNRFEPLPLKSQFKAANSSEQAAVSQNALHAYSTGTPPAFLIELADASRERAAPEDTRKSATTGPPTRKHFQLNGRHSNQLQSRGTTLK